MITPTFDAKSFNKEMDNLVKYSIGYVEGINLGKKKFFAGIGIATIELLKEYVDATARLNPEMLHHIYEWEQTGSPDARLYDIEYTVSNIGLSFLSSFSQSRSLAKGAKEPFYNKAKIMEDGIPVTIKPKRSDYLVFDVGDRTVFTKEPITVDNPGGSQTVGGFQKTLDSFFSKYFAQSFFIATGIGRYLESQTLYKSNMKAGARLGKAHGVSTGYKWIANAALGGA